jgi:hypothetical protein
VTEKGKSRDVTSAGTESDERIATISFSYGMRILRQQRPIIDHRIWGDPGPMWHDILILVSFVDNLQWAIKALWPASFSVIDLSVLQLVSEAPVLSKQIAFPETLPDSWSRCSTASYSSKWRPISPMAVPGQPPWTNPPLWTLPVLKDPISRYGPQVLDELVLWMLGTRRLNVQDW